MPFALVRHRVKDFDAWKPHFDNHDPVRREAGLRVAHLMRNADKPDEVWVLFEVADLGPARAMSQSEEVRQLMEEAGVIDKPDFVFLDSAG